MKNIIVVSFLEEANALEALLKLNELSTNGQITLNEHLIIRKKENGNYDRLYEKLCDKPEQELQSSIAIISHCGLAGVVTKFLKKVVEIFTIKAVGETQYDNYYQFNNGFIAEINDLMKVGNLAIIAKVSENDTAQIDSSLKQFIV